MTWTDTAWACSFCSTQAEDHTSVVTGLGAIICFACLRRLAEGRQLPSADRLSLAHNTETANNEIVAMVPLISQESEQVDLFLRAWVKELRRRGVSYADVGGALGVSRQATWQRFSPSS